MSVPFLGTYHKHLFCDRRLLSQSWPQVWPQVETSCPMSVPFSGRKYLLCDRRLTTQSWPPIFAYVGPRLGYAMSVPFSGTYHKHLLCDRRQTAQSWPLVLLMLVLFFIYLGLAYLGLCWPILSLDTSRRATRDLGPPCRHQFLYSEQQHVRIKFGKILVWIFFWWAVLTLS